MQGKYWIVFLEVLALIGAVAFFAGQHKQHLNDLQATLETIEQSVKASEVALQGLQKQKEAVACARVETDRKLLEAPDGDMRYDYYGRLLREDAERRGKHPAFGVCGEAADGVVIPVH